MKKRIACLLLGLLLVVPTLLMAGCSDDDTGTTTEEERYATTLSMLLVTDESTTPEAVAAVQDAINVITMAKYKTQIVLTTYTEDEYDKKLEERFTALETAADEAKKAAESRKAAENEAKKRGETVAKETTSDETTEEETQLNEYGVPELKYPAMTDNQIDIFYLSGIENLYKYYEADRLAFLDDELGSASKKLKDFIYPTFLDAAKIGGSSVAVINNHTIGEYTMLLIDKALADKYYYDTSEYDSLDDAAEFIADIAANEPGRTPFLEWVDCYDFKTWGDGRSMFGAEVNDYNTYGSSVSAQVIFRNSKFKEHFALMKQFQEAGYFSADPKNDTTFAAAVVTGSLEEKINYEKDYYVTVLQAPRAYNEDVYQGMFCINGYNDSNYVKRAMEIVMLINTEPEVRNLLQYGIEGVNYRLVNDKVLRLNDNYSMQLVNTGNEFIAYPTAEMPDNVWELGKQQNLDSSTYSLLGYHFDKDDQKLFNNANADADSIYALLESATYASLLRESNPSGDNYYLNPFDAAIDEAKMAPGFNSITTSALETNFGSKLQTWFESNFS